MTTIRTVALVLIGLASFAAAQSGGQLGPGVPAFEVRQGYKVTLAAEDFGKPARFLEFDDHGTLLVSQPQSGRIVALRDKDGDGTYETHTDFATDYKGVHSMHFVDGWLYATSAADGSCLRFADTDGDGKSDRREVVLPPGSVPAGGGHPFRGVCVTAQHIYVSVSDPSNMLDELPSERKCVYRFNRDGSGKMQFCTGVRNTEKLRLRPGTDELWGLDHGSDNFGKTYGESKGNQPITDLLPPEELNHLVEGGFYGHPYIAGPRIVRPEFAKRDDIVKLAAQTIPPAYAFGAHWAGNGFCFLAKDFFPDHQGDLFAAFHGSWNSSSKVGYRVDRVLFDKQTGKPYGNLPVVGALGDDPSRPLARPVDCVEAPDGTILFSCDLTHRIYRISRSDR